MADLTPDKKSPGLHVAAEPIYRSHDDSARWWKTTATTPTGSYTCGTCGESETARGTDKVRDLVDDYTANHGPAHRRK
ncbi:hypothetical protein [Streptomyces sp. NPDC002962]|uniref:hypothetical protein n=1 Tax=Streptomyces sp. NPDC002962 TaxID=3364674 RepID=UPI0036A4A457